MLAAVLARRGAGEVLATDINPRAVRCARENTRRVIRSRGDEPAPVPARLAMRSRRFKPSFRFLAGVALGIAGCASSRARLPDTDFRTARSGHDDGADGVTSARKPFRWCEHWRPPADRSRRCGDDSGRRRSHRVRRPGVLGRHPARGRVRRAGVAARP
ncbi:hypothetical protein [Nocardia xishanensis]